MKRVGLLVILLLLLALFGCASGTNQELVVSEPFQGTIRADNKMAVLVISRPNNIYGQVGFECYLDNKLISILHGNTWSVAMVEPGTHYLFAYFNGTRRLTSPVTMIRVNLEAGKIYHLGVISHPNALGSEVMEFLVMTEEELRTSMADLTYQKILPEYSGRPWPGKDWDAWEVHVRKYEEAYARNPKEYERFVTMSGF